MQDSARSQLLDLILNSTHDAIVAVDKDFRVFVFNPAAERVSGIPASRAIGKDVREVIETTRLDQVVSTGKPQLNQRQDIGNTTIITNRVPVRSPEGEVVGAVAVFRDITDVKDLAEEITNLRQVQTLLSSIINATQDAISVVDAEGNGILINPAYTRLTGLTHAGPPHPKARKEYPYESRAQTAVCRGDSRPCHSGRRAFGKRRSSS